MARLIGGAKTASLAGAPGVWAINEQRDKKAAGDWPEMISAARHWRFNFSAGHDLAYLMVAEFELMAEIGGSDLSDGKTATASSYYNPTYSPANGIDNSPATTWSTSTNGIPAWFSVDLGVGNPAVIREYRIRMSTIEGAYGPKSWELQSSNDGVNWTTVHTVTNAPAWANSEQRIYNGY